MQRHYNPSLFLLGFLSNLTKNFYLFIPAMILCVIGIWVKPCLYIGIVLLAIDVLISLIEQLQIKKAVETSTNPNFAPWTEMMSRDDWKDEIINAVNEKIAEQTAEADASDKLSNSDD